MARRYSRDNRGRFASGGTGATARGGRLKTASGNKRATQSTKAAPAKPSGTMAGKVKRNPTAASKIGKAKAAAPSTKAKSPKFVTEQSGRVRRAALGGGRTAIVRANSATIVNAKGEPIMTRKGLPNITAGKKWAANPNARGPRLMRNKFASEAAPSRDIARTSRPAGTIRKPRGTARAAAKPAAPKAARPSRFSAEDAGNRKRNAERLKAMPKDLRRADRTARLAQREVMATNGAVGGNVVGRRKSSTQSKINSIREGLMRAKGDKTGSIRNQVVKEAKTLRARMQTTAAGPRTGAQSGVKRRTTRAAAPKNTTPNRTGQSKTLNKFNSRPVGTMVAGKGINLVPSTKRVPLQVQRKESDVAFARVATKAARQRAAAPAKAAVRRTEANRTARALANQKRTVQTVLAKGGKRFSPTRKQKKSLAIADAASRFYSAKRVNSLPNFRVNTSKPGFRLPRNMR